MAVDRPADRTTGDRPRLRVAAVSYVNAWPLTAALGDRGEFEVAEDLPSAVARRLREGSADVGLVPVVEVLRQPDLEIVPGLAIAAFGPVDSVLVTLRRAPAAVRTLALDPASRTSQILAQVIFPGRYGIEPAVEECPHRIARADPRFDAALVIGDDALEFAANGTPRIDLAEAWCEWTGLPFVFAVWAARRGVLARHPDLARWLAEARAVGISRIPELARQAAARGGLSAEGWRVYLERRIRYGLGLPEEQGLRRFLGLAAAHLSVCEEAVRRCST